MTRRDVLAVLTLAAMDAPALAQGTKRRAGFLHPGQSTVLDNRISPMREGLAGNAGGTRLDMEIILLRANEVIE
jgi:hypothetical protein